jgi:hypothetical protein
MPIAPSSAHDAAALPVLQAGGFSASVDAYAWELDPDSASRRMRLWFLSLLGPQQSLKAVWARLLRGEVATLSQEALGSALFCVLAEREPRTWHSFTAALPGAGGHHLILLHDASRLNSSRPDILLLPRSIEEAARLHWRFLDRRLDLPLRPMWADWLWDRATRVGEAVALEAFGTLAYRCTPDLSALAAALSAAIREQRLPDEPGQEVGILPARATQPAAA